MQHPYRINFEYYRVPAVIKTPKKGSPTHRHLYKYVRGEGFVHLDVSELDAPVLVAEIIHEPSSKGGLTICNVTTPDGEQWVGHAQCSHSDNFCYALGRSISLGRALKLYNKETR